jgi:hypothetical protein
MLLGTRPEEQDVGPKATDIMSGVFEVFVNLTQVFAGDPKYKRNMRGYADHGVKKGNKYFFFWYSARLFVPLTTVEGTFA